MEEFKKTNKLYIIGIIILAISAIVSGFYLTKSNNVNKDNPPVGTISQEDETTNSKDEIFYKKYLVRKTPGQESRAFFISNPGNTIYSYSKSEGKKPFLITGELQECKVSSEFFTEFSIEGDYIYYGTDEGLCSIGVDGGIEKILDFSLFEEYFEGNSFERSELVFLDENTYVISLSSGDNYSQPDKALIIKGDISQKTGSIVIEEPDSKGLLKIQNRRSPDGYIYVTKGVPKGCGVWIDFLLDPNNFSKHDADGEPSLFGYEEELVSPDLKYIAKTIEHPEGRWYSDMCAIGHSPGIIKIFDKNNNVSEIENNPNNFYDLIGWTSDSKYFIYSINEMSDDFYDPYISTEYGIYSVGNGEKYVENNLEGLVNKLNSLFGAYIYEIFSLSIPDFDISNFNSKKPFGFMGVSEFFGPF